MTKEKLLAEMEAAVSYPGIQNAWTMPIKARVDMLTTGIRTPIGIKIFGADLNEIARIGEELETILAPVPGTRSVYAEREMGGFFLDFIPDRPAIARYGLKVMEVMQMVETAIGGLVVDTTIEGRERYRINVRDPRELRDNVEALRGVHGVLPSQMPAPARNRTVVDQGWTDIAAPARRTTANIRRTSDIAARPSGALRTPARG